MKIHNHKSIHIQSGFTLLEVMLALVIFSVGLLGLAGMQMSGLQNNNDAMLRTLAYQQLYDMAERVRGNWSGYQNGDYNSLSGSVAVAACSPCTTGQQASNDFAEWETSNATALPDGTGSVARDPAGNVIITLNWTDRTTGATNTASLGIIP
ncbi:MAG: type IV pilus modification protein PilV [Gammaproteobacteria bacterium]|nr:type IV pilus modification protein PilV [Gammaproteobacteria bacterium]MDH5651155.1 type IV pilus modification protein PilV [Gammaproteobacteria bacterium]